MSLTQVRRLGAAEAEVFRHLRLDGLRRHPEAFGESYAEAAARPPHHWPELLERSAVFGGWRDGRLGATASCATGADIGLPANLRHKALLVGVYVAPRARGTGLGRAVCQAAVDHARALPGIDLMLVSVNADNAGAVALYEALGFVAWGRQPRSIKVAGRHYDEIEMALLFAEAPAE